MADWLADLSDRLRFRPDLDGGAEGVNNVDMDEREKSLSAAVTLLREELSRRNGVSRDVVDGLHELVLTAIGKRGAMTSQRGARPRLVDARIARVLACVRERPSERWTIARMAKLAGMSRAAFIRLFTRATGSPPLTYVTRLRIDVACALLAETEEAAAAIAARVGYGSVYAFTRAFTRLTGKPPILFRKTARGVTTIVGRATFCVAA
ncbi:MAG: AraC family transcriptional regulator [Polyangiaceae bacterium]